MKSKPFFIGALAVGWIGLAVLSSAGPGDSGHLMLLMLAPVVLLASAAGVVWGILERGRSKTRPRFNTAGIVLNGIVVGLAFCGGCLWFSASVWPTLSFRFPKDVPIYPGARFILKQTTTRADNGAVERKWDLFASPQYGDTRSEYEKAEAFYDKQLPSAGKQRADGVVHYSYVTPKGKRIKISIDRASSIRIRESNEAK